MLLSVTAHEPNPIAYYILAGVLLILFYMIAKGIENYRNPPKPVIKKPLTPAQIKKIKEREERFATIFGSIILFGFLAFLLYEGGLFFALCVIIIIYASYVFGNQISR